MTSLQFGSSRGNAISCKPMPAPKFNRADTSARPLRLSIINRNRPGGRVICLGSNPCGVTVISSLSKSAIGRVLCCAMEVTVSDDWGFAPTDNFGALLVDRADANQPSSLTAITTRKIDTATDRNFPCGPIDKRRHQVLCDMICS